MLTNFVSFGTISQGFMIVSAFICMLAYDGFGCLIEMLRFALIFACGSTTVLWFQMVVITAI